MTDPVKSIPDIISECALWTGKTGVCVSAAAIAEMANAFNINESLEPEEILQEAKTKTGCSNQKCVIKKLGNAVDQKTELGFLKLTGPIDNTLLSNVDIDTTLKSWQNRFPDFFPYNFNMLDYKSFSFRNGRVLNEPDTLRTISMDKLHPRYNRMACVINSDKYQGPGKHWMALFVDVPNRTIEFFNSSGNNPHVAWVDWMVKTRNELENLCHDCELVKVSTIRHQNSKTECGVYSLFYIWSRLTGVPPQYFLENKVDDEHIFKFRQHLFAGPQQMPVWNWEEFQKRYPLKWE